MANATFAPTGGTREAFNELFQLPAQLAEESETRRSADQSLSATIAEIFVELPMLKLRMNTLEARIEALEEGSADA